MTPVQVNDAFTYDASTGVIRWKHSSRGVSAGAVAGRKNRKGYVEIRTRGRTYQAHRIAYAIMTGDWPPSDIDHIDGCTHNNAWSNLRSATRSENAANSSVRVNNVVGLKGVAKHKRSGKFRAKICVNYKSVWLGEFDCPAAASFAYQIAADKAFGAYARAK